VDSTPLPPASLFSRLLYLKSELLHFTRSLLQPESALNLHAIFTFDIYVEYEEWRHPPAITCRNHHPDARLAVALRIDEVARAMTDRLWTYHAPGKQAYSPAPSNEGGWTEWQ